MSLTGYQQKRKFNETSEPRGKTIKTHYDKLTFVVQEHNASHLHWDFRLEHNRVLKSWAVPKGPSMHMGDRRLAINVEDHPLEYAKFHGTIPEGNYGAGTVKIWDVGIYVPLKISKKHWEFILKGKKLKGKFSLIKIVGNKNWLLMKMKDDEIRKNYNDDEMPHDIKPMLATLIDEPFDKKDWVFEIKWDGYRAIAEIEKGEVKLYSRNFQSFKEKFSTITSELKKIPHNTVLDGEIVALDKKGKPSFQSLQNYKKKSKN